MHFRVEHRPQNLYVIVPEGREPLPALFDNCEQAQRIVDNLGRRASVGQKTRGELGYGFMLPAIERKRCS